MNSDCTVLYLLQCFLQFSVKPDHQSCQQLTKPLVKVFWLSLHSVPKPAPSASATFMVQSGAPWSQLIHTDSTDSHMAVPGYLERSAVGHISEKLIT